MDYVKCLKNLSMFHLLKSHQYASDLISNTGKHQKKYLAMVNAPFASMKINRTQRLKILSYLFNKPVESSKDLMVCEAVALYRMLHTPGVSSDNFIEYCKGVIYGQ